MQVHALLAERLEMVADADSRVDWAMAEALAFGTLLLHRYDAPYMSCGRRTATTAGTGQALSCSVTNSSSTML